MAQTLQLPVIVITEEKMHLIKLLLAATVSAISAFAAASPVLLGNGTQTVANDLTLIKTDSNVQLEFLDLTSTNGVSYNNALATHATAGFHVATWGEIQVLLSAFGFSNFAADPDGISRPISTAEQRSSFVSYLGSTYGAVGEQSLGLYDMGSDMTGRGCVANDLCWPTAFFGNANLALSVDPRTTAMLGTGIYLVRSAALQDEATVPEPGTLALTGLGLLGACVSRRRRKALSPATGIQSAL